MAAPAAARQKVANAALSGGVLRDAFTFTGVPNSSRPALSHGPVSGLHLHG